MNVVVKQQNTDDCGVACLVSIARHYGYRVPFSLIRQRAGTDSKGTSLNGLIDAASSLGFKAQGFRAKPEHLETLPLPMIAHLHIGDSLHHYVVVYRVRNHKLRVMDPGLGRMANVRSEDFESMWTGVLMLIVPDDGGLKIDKATTVRSRIIRLMAMYKSTLTQALFGAVIYTILGLALSIYLQKLVDFVVGDSNYQLLTLLGVVMLVVVLLQVFVGAVKNFLVLRTGQAIDARLILAFHQKLMRLPLSFFDKMRTGEITSRFGDAVKIRVLVNDLAISAAVSLCTVFMAAILMFTYYWKLALVIVCVIPIYCLIYYCTDRYNRNAQRKVMEDAASLEAKLVENLNASAAIRQMNLQRLAHQEAGHRLSNLLSSLYISGRNSILSTASTDFVSQIATVMVLWIGAFCVLGNKISLGEMLSFYALTIYFFGPASSLVSVNKSVQDAIIAADRLFDILDMESEEPTDGSLIDLPAGKTGNISFKNVSFAYTLSDPVFTHLNMQIPGGKITGIVGPNGSGKSTIAALLHRLYDFGGSISIGKYDLRDISHQSLRDRIALVPQDIQLFDGTILSNIAVGDPAPDMARVTEICESLGINSFAEKLPLRYRTSIGANGQSLSGGQRQRIAIARALYRDPDILFLDEPTAHLDPLSEQMVQSAIWAFAAKGKTVVIIAHRLSTLKSVDKIIVLGYGEVLEEGTHQRLLSNGMVYTALWASEGDEIAEIVRNTVQEAETEKPE